MSKAYMQQFSFAEHNSPASISSTPKMIEQFEAVLSEFIDMSSIVTTSNSSTALMTALRLADVGKNDYVISTPMTFITTNLSIATLSARVIWADVDAITGMVTPDTIEFALLTAHRRDIFPKAVICTSWVGTPPDLIGIAKVCRQYDVHMIHDATNAFGAQIDGRDVSQLSDFTCFNFDSTSQLRTCGDIGGLLVCKNCDHLPRAKSIVKFGTDYDLNVKVDHMLNSGQSMFGMNDTTAATCKTQLEHLQEKLIVCRHNASIYDNIFSTVGNVRVATPASGVTPTCWAYTAHVDACQRDDLICKLYNLGTSAGILCDSNDRYSCFDYARVALCGVETFSKRQITLPCGWWLTQHAVEYIANSVISQLLIC